RGVRAHRRRGRAHGRRRAGRRRAHGRGRGHPLSSYGSRGPTPARARNDRARAGVGELMTTIGFIGSGRIGGTVARLSVAAGHRVVLSNSRGPDTLKDLAAELGPPATAGTGQPSAGAGAPDRGALPIAGDDEAAKAAVTAFLDSIGYDTVDAGALTGSWRQEPGSPVYGAPYGAFSDPAGIPASAATIRAALSAARR